jgi:hypothetical protein
VRVVEIGVAEIGVVEIGVVEGVFDRAAGDRRALISPR